jgi:hypothetical protein
MEGEDQSQHSRLSSPGPSNDGYALRLLTIAHVRSAGVDSERTRASVCPDNREDEQTQKGTEPARARPTVHRAPSSAPR